MSGTVLVTAALALCAVGLGGYGALAALVWALERRERREADEALGLDLARPALTAAEREIAACTDAIERRKREVTEAERELRAFGTTSRGPEYRAELARAKSARDEAVVARTEARARELELRVRCAAAAIGRHALALLDERDRTSGPRQLQSRAEQATRDLARRFESVHGRPAPADLAAPVMGAVRDATELLAKVTLARRREATQLREVTGTPAPKRGESGDEARVDGVVEAFRRRLDEAEALLQLDDELRGRH